MSGVYDIAIIGGGPAGVAAGVYAARKKLKTLLITESFGGQSIVASSIENWIGSISISGYELAKSLESHLRQQENTEIKISEKATYIKKIKAGFEIKSNKDSIYRSKTIVVASGGRRKHLGVPGEEKFEGKGVSYCATCDAPIFKDKTVAVTGGGNAGLEAVIDLFPYANKIYLMIRGEELRGDPATREEIKNLPKVSILYNSEIKEISGGNVVKKIKFRDRKNGEKMEIEVQGLFVEIGSVPNSEFVENLVKVNKRGEIIINPRTGETSMEGIYAAGDITDEIFKQNNIAVGDAIKATLSAYNYILKLRKAT